MKGISPLIAGVLLITFTMAVAAIIGVFGTTFSKGETEKITTSSECIGALQIDPLSVKFVKSTKTLSGRVINYGRQELESLNVRIYYSDNTILTKNITETISAGSSSVLNIYTGKNDIPEKVSIFAENCGPYYSASLKMSSDNVIQGQGHYDYTKDPNIVSCWYLDEATGLRYDACRGNNLTSYNNVGQDTVNFMQGSASGDFGINNDKRYLLCDNPDCNNNDFNILTSLSFGCWARAVDEADEYYIIDMLDSNNDGYRLTRDQTTKALRCYIGGGITYNSAVSSLFSFPLNNFQHVACVYDNNAVPANRKIYVYVNGSKKGESSHSPFLGSTATFMLSGTFQSEFWHGQLDECFVFDRILNEKEICEICRFGIDGKHADRGVQCGNCVYK